MKNEIRNAMRFISAFVALMVGDKVSVRWSERAGLSPDGQIYLPMPKTGEATEIALLTRLAVHEAGHKVHTETGYDARLTEEEVAIFNALEDPRMEAKQAAKFPGAPLILARGLDELLDCIQERMDGPTPFDGVRALQLDLVLRGSLAVAPNSSLLMRAPKILASLAGAISDQEREAVDVAIKALPAMQTSIDAESAAREFIARLRVEPAPETPQAESDVPDEQSDNDGQGSEAADGGGANAQESSEGEETPPETPAPTDSSETEPVQPGNSEAVNEPVGAPTSSASPDDVAGETDDPQGQPTGNGGATGNESQDQDGRATDTDSETKPLSGAGSADLGDMLREAHAARFGERAQDERGDLPAEDSTDDQLGRMAAMLANVDPDCSLEELIEACCDALQPFEGIPLQEADADSIGNVAASAGYSLAADGAEVSTVLDVRLLGVQSRLVTVLQRELQDTRRRPTRPAHAGGRVAPTRFWRLKAVGDTRIFNVRRMAPGIDAAATVLVDKSGSTARTLQNAAEVALAFSLAMQRLGKVRTSVATFPGTSQVTEVLQAFGESPKACVRKCADLVASGGTPLGAAMVIELSRLLEQRRPKNLLVVITDDKPGDPETVLHAIRHATARGIDVVGVAIGCDIRGFIPRAISIGSAADLPDALSKLFREDVSATLSA